MLEKPKTSIGKTNPKNHSQEQRNRGHILQNLKALIFKVDWWNIVLGVCMVGLGADVVA